MASSYQIGRQATGEAKRALSHSWVELLERVGYVARGLVYTIMGALACGLALGVGGMATDMNGSLVVLTSSSLGKMLLLVVGIGLVAYALWGFVRAIFDPLHRGKDAPGIVERLGFVWSGICYAALAMFALQLFAGTGSKAAADSTQTTIAKVLAYPAGKWIAVGIGLGAIAVGVYQFYMSFKANLKRDLKRDEMSKTEEDLVEMLGRVGFFSRGVVFTLVGWFVVEGGLHKDPSRVHGYSGAFLFLLAQPYGHVLLAVVALGFVALGFHSFASARWMRLMGSRS
ncbi:MAG TPA: DUF1206 domain-containing protein [Candidatus Dormibacteraeota bacterium]|jgi:uncharacterized membrane protein YidH (DUF202 family)